MEKGEHLFTVPLPFDAQEEYDADRMPPTWDDRKATIRYVCRVSTKPWIRNQYQERPFKFTRTRTDGSDQGMLEPYRATTGETISKNGDLFCTVHLPSRAFTRGTYIPISVRARSQTIEVKKVEATLQQYCEFRQPKGGKYQVSQFDESIARADSTDKQPKHQFKLAIPADVSPNIHWCYWNVVNVWYELIVSVHGGGGVHRQVIPVDITAHGDRHPMDYDPIDDDEDGYVPVPVRTESQREPARHREVDTPRDQYYIEEEEDRPDSASGFYGTEGYVEPEWVGRLNMDAYKRV
uniref:Arrestin C-terminal-like domain-containing protein n=1 Tax=Plectus sambesii TaxID=2011161 RepID=A0A914USM8_9BILA